MATIQATNVDNGTAGVKGMLGGTSARDLLTKKILSSLSKPAGDSTTKQYQDLTTQKDIPGKEAVVESYNTEISKTMSLLDSLEGDIKSRTGDYLVSEANRKRILASEKDPLSGILKTLQTGEKQASSELSTAKKDITTEMSFRQKDTAAGGTTDKNEINLLKELDKIENPTRTTAVRNIGGRQLLIDTKTGETVKDLGAAASAAPKAGNTLTLTEAVNKGLPPEMVGMSESQVAKDLGSEKAPSWFKNKIESDKKMSLTPTALTSLWSAFRSGFVDEKGNLKKPAKSTSGAGAIPNPFATPAK